jgi:SAM-dependent methyltransferase
MKDVGKQLVHEFWEKAACGEELYLCGSEKAAYIEQGRIRYELEPYIPAFAGFERTNGLDVLEIGVGLGADHQRFAEAGAKLQGIDLTQRAVSLTNKRLQLFGLPSKVQIGDAEQLVFADESFDVVYSWGVLHHSPNTQRAIQEVHRVLRRGGRAQIMIYHKWSMIGLMLWIRYGLLRCRPHVTLRELYGKYLESPGTKAFTVTEARKLFAMFRSVDIRTIMTHGDLLASQAGQRHDGILLQMAKRIWPRWLIKAILPKNGLFMLITAMK